VQDTQVAFVRYDTCAISGLIVRNGLINGTVIFFSRQNQRDQRNRIAVPSYLRSFSVANLIHV